MSSTANPTLDPPVVQEDVGAVVVLSATTIGYGAWGKGRTEAEAKRNARQTGRADFAKRGYTVLTFDSVTEFMGVDQMGRVSWRAIDGTKAKDHEPAVREVAPTKASR